MHYSEPAEELRIIAQDESRLGLLDRAALNRAADELDLAHKLLVVSNMSLIETQQKLIAVNDQLIATRKNQWQKS